MTDIITERDPITVFTPPPHARRPAWLEVVWTYVQATDRYYQEVVDREYASEEPDYNKMHEALEASNVAHAYYTDMYNMWMRGETPASVKSWEDAPKDGVAC